MEQTTTLNHEYLFSLEATVDAPQNAGARVVVPITGGSVYGPKINGTILPGGADWVTIRPDGSAVLDVRANIKTDDGAIIYCFYPGIIAPSVTDRKYWRTTPRFETASEKYTWLNNVIAVGVGIPNPDASIVQYDVYEIL